MIQITSLFHIKDLSTGRKKKQGGIECARKKGGGGGFG